MIILHFPSWFPNAEAPYKGNFILRQIAAMADRTTSIVMHHVKDDFPTESLDYGTDINYHLIHTNKNSKISLFISYLRAYRKVRKTYGKPDVIHLHVAMPLGIVAAYLARRHHIPFVISEHWSIYQPQNRSQINWIQKLMFGYIYRTASVFVTVSFNLTEAIYNTIPASRKLVGMNVSNVVDTEEFKPIESTPNSIKQILHISTLDNDAKNIMGILKAVQALSHRRDDFCLNIIHDLRNPVVEEFIQRNHLEKQIVLLGKKTTSEVAKALQKCDFLLMFSNYENQPCVILEAHCCGKPVLTTPVGGIPEICHERNALFVEVQNEAQLVERIDYMLDHASSYDSQEISAEASREYSYDTIGQHLIGVYRFIGIK